MRNYDKQHILLVCGSLPLVTLAIGGNKVNPSFKFFIPVFQLTSEFQQGGHTYGRMDLHIIYAACGLATDIGWSLREKGWARQTSGRVQGFLMLKRGEMKLLKEALSIATTTTTTKMRDIEFKLPSTF